ncbi:hypothetical protein H5410_046962 [Solanum commersonii]|uniref:Uncharacterized protein n=1 Tax=Solanum commersonii TaxID=4109 RepID=A0A9J5XHW2_SOLCO|nr:hypothetical protein H5410_046962 [Solanum commersonii]
MDNEIQKLKTNEDNLKSKASQQHDYKNAELRTSKQVSNKQHKNANLNQLFEKPFTQRTPRHMSIEPQTSTYANTPAEILYEEIKSPIQVIKIGLTKAMIIPKDIGQQEEICKIEIPSFYANKRIIGISTIIQELANNYLNENAIWRKQIWMKSSEWILSLLKPEEQPTTRALKTGFISKELLTRYCKLIGHKYPDHICSKCNEEDNIIPDVQLE